MTIHQTIIRAAASATEQRYLDLYAAVADQLPGASSEEVRSWRGAALDAFGETGFPHRRQEEWKYTDLRSLMPEVLPLAGLDPIEAAAKVSNIDLGAVIGPALANLDVYRAVFVNGRYRDDLSSVIDISGVRFMSLHEALRDHDTAKQSIAHLMDLEGDAVSALSSAFATDGAMIDIAAGVKLDRPLHLIFIGNADAAHSIALQNTVRLGDGASATLIETHTHNTVDHVFAASRIVLGKVARLRHARANLGDGAAKHLSTISTTLDQRAEYDPLQLTISGGVTRAQSHICFNGEGGRCHYTGAMMQRGTSHCDFTLVVDHAAVGCESRELVKVVLDGRSRGVFQAKVLVRQHAQKTDGKQMSNALLLSDDAEFDAKPELEIYADDVTCGHGATAAQLDDDMLFYLRARGLPENEARALLIQAFVGETLDKIEHEPLRAALQEKVDSWLVGS